MVRSWGSVRVLRMATEWLEWGMLGELLCCQYTALLCFRHSNFPRNFQARRPSSIDKLSADRQPPLADNQVHKDTHTCCGLMLVGLNWIAGFFWIIFFTSTQTVRRKCARQSKPNAIDVSFGGSEREHSINVTGNWVQTISESYPVPRWLDYLFWIYEIPHFGGYTYYLVHLSY